MTKYVIMLACAASLSACMGGSDTSVSAKVTTVGPMSCGNNMYMQGTSDMPVRCGPQTQSPYTFQ